MKKRKGPAPNANEKQLRAAAHMGMDKTMVYCLTALADKMGFDRDKLVDFIHAVADVADSVVKGYVNYEQLHKVLVDEQGLEW